MQNKFKKPKTKKESLFIYGRHAVMEALKSRPEVITKVFLDVKNRGGDLEKLLSSHKIAVGDLGSEKNRVKEGGSHQGVIAKISPTALVQSYEEFIKTFKVSPETAFLLLDEVQDPHNVGAVIRSAAAFGISAVLIPKHNQAGITGSVVKVSSGMAFQVPIIQIGNVNETVRDLKDKGFWIYGLDANGDTKLVEEKFEQASVFILGNEAEGIREKTRELCDHIISIPMSPRCESLNASVSAAIVLYTWSTRHKEALKK